MIRKYRLPIKGKVWDDTPLLGDENNPITVVPLSELVPKVQRFDPEGNPIQVSKFGGYRYICLDYDVDSELCEIELEASEAFHTWLAASLPTFSKMAKAKDWVLDKTELEKVRLARQSWRRNEPSNS